MEILYLPLGEYCISRWISRLPLVTCSSWCLFQPEQNTEKCVFSDISPILNILNLQMVMKEKLCFRYLGVLSQEELSDRALQAVWQR